MNRRTLAVVATLLATGSLAGGADDETKKEWQRLAGTWQSLTYALDGKEAPADELKPLRLMIEPDGKASLRRDDKPIIEAELKIDPTKDPKTMDLTYTRGEVKGKALGIYKIEGDTLTICRAADGKPRPTEFSSKPGSGHTLMTYRREKK